MEEKHEIISLYTSIKNSFNVSYYFVGFGAQVQRVGVIILLIPQCTIILGPCRVFQKFSLSLTTYQQCKSSLLPTPSPSLGVIYLSTFVKWEESNFYLKLRLSALTLNRFYNTWNLRVIN